MQGNVKDVPARSLEPRRQATKFIVLLQQENFHAVAGENVRRGETAKPAADHDDVVFVGGSFEKVFGHRNVEMKMIWKAVRISQTVKKLND